MQLSAFHFGKKSLIACPQNHEGSATDLSTLSFQQQHFQLRPFIYLHLAFVLHATSVLEIAAALALQFFSDFIQLKVETAIMDGNAIYLRWVALLSLFLLLLLRSVGMDMG